NAGEIDAFEAYLAADAPRRRDESHDRKRGDALATAGFADDGERAPGIEREAHPGDRREHAGLDRERRPEIADLEQNALMYPHACGLIGQFGRRAAPRGGA